MSSHFTFSHSKPYYTLLFPDRSRCVFCFIIHHTLFYAFLIFIFTLHCITSTFFTPQSHFSTMPAQIHFCFCVYVAILFNQTLTPPNNSNPYAFFFSILFFVPRFSLINESILRPTFLTNTQQRVSYSVLITSFLVFNICYDG